MKKAEWFIGEELVYFREDPSSRLKTDKFYNIINDENSSQRTLRPANTAKNTVILPNFLVWKSYGKAQFPHSFGRIA